jgi:hypothetical protein
MSCSGHAEEEAHYYHILSEFASLVKVMGVNQVMTDMWNYQMDATLLVEQYFDDRQL